MRRTVKITIAILAAIVLLIGTYCLLRFGLHKDVLDQSGWHTDEGETRYLDYFGQPQLQWQNISGKTYYFDPQTGVMVTGWLELAGDRYYFAKDGALTYGLLALDGRTYYLDESGKMVTGWQELDSQLCFFDEDGAMATGWQEIADKRYFFTQDGIMSVGWLEEAGERYYLNESGNPVTGWTQVDETQYLFAENGVLVTGWYTDDTGIYYLEEDGQVHTGWLDWEGDRYYLDKTGALQTGWQEIAGDWYYLDQTGVMQTGWFELGEDRCYLNPNGAMAVGMTFVNGVPAFFTSQGKNFLFINSDYGMPEGYIADLVYVDGYQLDRECAAALEEMLDDCDTAGLWWSINDAYRSKLDQQAIWDVRIKRYMNQGYTYQDAVALVGTSVAVPGYSEHETGLAVDIGGSSATYRWLAENCWDYGFILRYPEGCTEHTGIVYEPWHFRYVGTELALEMEELGICLEEYVDMLNMQKKSQS